MLSGRGSQTLDIAQRTLAPVARKESHCFFLEFTHSQIRMLAVVTHLHGLDVTNTTWRDSVDNVASESLVFIYVNFIST